MESKELFKPGDIKISSKRCGEYAKILETALNRPENIKMINKNIEKEFPTLKQDMLNYLMWGYGSSEK